MTDRAGIDFSVVICAYTEERWEELLAAVESVRRQTLPPREIILVVDHNPALFERARAGLPGLAVLENGEARGLSGARNTGLKCAAGQVVAFMDEDAMAEPDWLEQLAAAYSRPEVAGVGGSIVPAWSGARPPWFPEEFDWVVGCTYRGLPETVAPVRNLIGANMSFRRQVFQAAGGFRTGIGRIGKVPLGCEETELCIRASQRQPGLLLLYQPQARVRHRVPPSRARWGYFFARCYAEGRSKALVTRFVGSRDGLASERAYTWKVLPQAALHALADGLLRGRASGFLRAFAIAAGWALTAAGYGSGLLWSGLQQAGQPSASP